MEEADALCSRVGIMVKGELRCLGSTQHLKNRYGAGYNLEIKLKQVDSKVNSSNFENMQSEAKKQCLDFVHELFPDSVVEDSFGDRIVSSIPQHNVSSLAQCFESLEKGRFLKFLCNLSLNMTFHSKQRKFHLASKSSVSVKQPWNRSS